MCNVHSTQYLDRGHNNDSNIFYVLKPVSDISFMAEDNNNKNKKVVDFWKFKKKYRTL